MGKSWPALDIDVVCPVPDSRLHELILAKLDDFQPTAIQEPDDDSRLRAFFRTQESRDAAAEALGVSFGRDVKVHTVDIDDEDWAARSQAQLRALTIGRLVVAPPWDTEMSRATRSLFVVIRPSMGFGTGHHATTRLALTALQELSLDDRTVLDIGCGSGVLAIAAVTLGARSAVGIDIDPDALENANDNARLNDLDNRVHFEEADFRQSSTRAQIVLANLTGALLEQSAETLAHLVEPEGFLIVSGFMTSEKHSVVPTLEQFLELKTVEQEDEWLCAVFRKAGSAQGSRHT